MWHGEEKYCDTQIQNRVNGLYLGMRNCSRSIDDRQIKTKLWPDSRGGASGSRIFYRKTLVHVGANG